VIIKLIKYLLNFLVDLFFFILLHIFFHAVFENYSLAFLTILFIYLAFLIKIRQELSLILPIVLAFFIFTLTVPVMNDRSGTVFMMKTIDKAPGITKANLSEKLENEYLREDFFLNKRIKEEMNVGNIIEEDKKFFTTIKGSLFVKFYILMEKAYSK